MRLYDLTKELLINEPIYRDSDKLLIYGVWRRLGFASENYISKASLLNKRCPSPESITRCRRKIQEYHPELGATKKVRAVREDKYADKGNHIFRQDVVKSALIPPLTHIEFIGDKAVIVKGGE